MNIFFLSLCSLIASTTFRSSQATDMTMATTMVRGSFHGVKLGFDLNSVSRPWSLFKPLKNKATNQLPKSLILKEKTYCRFPLQIVTIASRKLIVVLNVVRNTTVNSWLIGGIRFQKYLDMYRKIMDSMTDKAVNSAHIFPINGTIQVMFSGKSKGVRADHPTEMGKQKI